MLTLTLTRTLTRTRTLILTLTLTLTRTLTRTLTLTLTLTRLGNYYASDLPSALERAGLVGSMISSLETAQLTQVLGAGQA